MSFFKHTLIALGALSLLACNDEAPLRGGIGSKSLQKPVTGDALPSTSSPADPAASPAAPAPVDPELSFGILVEEGAVVIPQQMSNAVPSIKNAADGTLLSADQLKGWTVKIHREDDVATAASKIEPQLVDLSAVSHLVKVVADFSNGAGKSGSASQTLYVDAEAPKVNLLRISDAADGKTSQIAWTATDDYKLNEAKLLMIGCTSYVQSLSPRSRADLNTLPANCVIVHEGAALVAQPAQIAMTAKTIAGVSLAPKSIIFGLFAEDMVGQTAFTWINTPEQEKGFLTLKATPDAKVYTNNASMPATLKLTHIDAGTVIQVDEAANSKLWPNYEISTVATPASASIAAQAFKSTLPLAFTAEGLYTHVIQAKEKSSGIVSNTQTILYLYDKTPPVVGPLQITLDTTVPIPETKVSVTWKVTEANGIGKQVLEIKGASGVWTVVPVTIATTATTATFVWGTRLSENFEARITATDLAGNSGSNTGKWVKQIFNAAVITSSTSCFFCHMKIEGDVGGIDFPAQAALHGNTGRNFVISGDIYGTNTVPATMVKATTGTSNSNYANTDFKIFPKNKVFPVLTAASLSTKTQGTLKQGANTLVNKTSSGNLKLIGTDANPLILNGEVFIDGDIVIGGKYKGVGTIYAQNVFIASDLVAVSSAFPFPSAPAAAMIAAQKAIENHKDGLYLGAIKQVIIGNPDAANDLDLVNPKTNTKFAYANPYSWMTIADFQALGTQATYVKYADGTDAGLPTTGFRSGNPTTNPAFRNEVNKVEAYLYSQEMISWRSYSNILLNGGFMTPVGGFVSAVPEIIWQRQYGNNNTAVTTDAQLATYQKNPKNGTAVNTNYVFYDYRLRIGGGGFETLKTYFDQQ